MQKSGQLLECYSCNEAVRAIRQYIPSAQQIDQLSKPRHSSDNLIQCEACNRNTCNEHAHHIKESVRCELCL